MSGHNLQRDVREHFQLVEEGFKDHNDEYWFVRGTTVPSDGATGYAPGCLFIKSDGGADTTLYVNEGTAASADFNAK